MPNVLNARAYPPGTTAASSLPVSVVRPEASFRLASVPRAVGVGVPAWHAVFPQEAECAGAANDRSAEASADAVQARAGWARAGYSAELSAAGLEPAVRGVCWAALPANVWAPHGSIPSGYSP